MSLLHKHISEFTDPDIQSFLGELKDATMAAPEPKLMLLHYLQVCHHPLGASDKWQRIDRNSIVPGRLLDRRIGQLNAPLVHQLCMEIAQKHGLNAEAVESVRLYEFLNKYTPHPLKKDRKKPHDPRDTLRRMGF